MRTYNLIKPTGQLEGLAFILAKLVDNAGEVKINFSILNDLSQDAVETETVSNICSAILKFRKIRNDKSLKFLGCGRLYRQSKTSRSFRLPVVVSVQCH